MDGRVLGRASLRSPRRRVRAVARPGALGPGHGPPPRDLADLRTRRSEPRQGRVRAPAGDLGAGATGARLRVGERMTVRGVIADKDTPISVIMSALFGTDPSDPEILAVERMSDDEIAREAAKLRHLVRRPVPGEKDAVIRKWCHQMRAGRA